MKIKNKNKAIFEAKDDGIEAVADINAAKDSEASIEDALSDFADDTGLESEIDPKAAAKEVKAVGKEIGKVSGNTEVAVLPPKETSKNRQHVFRIENALTKKLDRALRLWVDGHRHNDETGDLIDVGTSDRNPNVLVIGVPGSSKTATVKNWAALNGVNLVSVNAKNPDLEISVQGMPDRDPDEPGTIIQYKSKILKPLHQPRSVLFLDEFNRQIDEGIRGSLLTLINEKTVGGKDSGVQEYFGDTLMFCVICINPPSPTDYVRNLNAPELTRSLLRVKFDSTRESALSYFNQFYPYSILSCIKEGTGEHKGGYREEDFKADLLDNIHCYEMAIRLLTMKDGNDYILNFTDAVEYSTAETEPFTQRTLTALLLNSEGDPQNVIDDANDLNLNPQVQEAIELILNSYKPMTEAKAMSYVKSGKVAQLLKDISGAVDTDLLDEFDFDGEETDPDLFAEEEEADSEISDGLDGFFNSVVED